MCPPIRWLWFHGTQLLTKHMKPRPVLLNMKKVGGLHKTLRSWMAILGYARIYFNINSIIPYSFCVGSHTVYLASWFSWSNSTNTISCPHMHFFLNIHSIVFHYRACHDTFNPSPSVHLLGHFHLFLPKNRCLWSRPLVILLIIPIG